VLVVTRYRVDAGDRQAFLSRAAAALAALAERPGFVTGDVGRNVDDDALFTLTTRWRDTGSYRRALGGFDVKTTAVPLLSLALDEPTAYEVLVEQSAPASGDAE
jgi:quinol monooxygenase YgiN